MIRPEIERKFLVQVVPTNLEDYPATDIHQFYVKDAKGQTVRYRKVGQRYYATIKQGHGLERTENERQVQEKRFLEMWPKAKDHELYKHRHYIPDASGLTFELDVFHDKLAGLIMVEVEFKTVKEAKNFRPPPWFGREVTADPNYSNSFLAINGRPGGG